MYRVWELSEKDEKEVEYLLDALANEISRLNERRINLIENNESGINSKFADRIKERIEILDAIWEKVYKEW